MGCTVEELGERMSSAEFTEWAVMFAHDPWGEQRADLRAAQLAALFYNAHRGPQAPPGKLADFMPYRPFEPEPEPEPESDEHAAARLMGQINAHNARLRR